MLATFTTKEGLLVIRAEDLRRIQDQPIGCMITWIEADEACSQIVLGTAQENLDHIIAAEVQQLAAYEAMQRRAQQGLPGLPVVRGGKVRP